MGNWSPRVLIPGQGACEVESVENGLRGAGKGGGLGCEGPYSCVNAAIDRYLALSPQPHRRGGLTLAINYDYD